MKSSTKEMKSERRCWIDPIQRVVLPDGRRQHLLAKLGEQALNLLGICAERHQEQSRREGAAPIQRVCHVRHERVLRLWRELFVSLALKLLGRLELEARVAHSLAHLLARGCRGAHVGRIGGGLL